MHQVDLTEHWTGLTALLAFVVAYAAVVAEERLQLRKSVPVLVAAGVIWILVAIGYTAHGDVDGAAAAARHTFLEFAEFFFFLLVAMTYVNTMTERGVFDALRAFLLGRGLSYRALFWSTGALAFWISPFIDNLTTALVMGAVVIAVAPDRPRFVALACINVVVGANAGGTFSPFGDVTTLMVWQAGVVPFEGFIPLLLPALVNWLVPAALMSLAVERGQPPRVEETAGLHLGGASVVGLFFLTIAVTVTLHNLLHIPPAFGMMFGLGLLMLFTYGFNQFAVDTFEDTFASPARPIHAFALMEKVEWDTLIFFYGVLLSVGGLGALGYLARLSAVLYGGMGNTIANVVIGLLSAVVDNVPVMFAVLAMRPDMPREQWLLVTLTAGVGGSLLSVGSAAGIALMGQARGAYTFGMHLRWSWAIALAHAASIALHLLLNSRA